VEHVLLSAGSRVPLTPKAFETLLVLVESAGHILEKDDLLKRVWPDTFVEEGTLARNISTLRKALGDDPEGETYIETVPRRGYCLVAAVQQVPYEEPGGFVTSSAEQQTTAGVEPRSSWPQRRLTTGLVFISNLYLSPAGWGLCSVAALLASWRSFRQSNHAGGFTF
jgi:DNA-binding winged helix-turn-helix (wHTH) protein